MYKPRPIVYVVDDHPSIRKSVGYLLSLAGFQVMSFSSPDEFLKICKDAKQGCLLLDVYMPGMNGLRLQRLLNDLDFHLPVIFMTGTGDISSSVQAMKMGALDFIQKPFDARTLIKAVEKALEKNRIELAVRGMTDAAREKLALLSPREKDVLKLAVKGLLNKQIASELGIAEATVKIHRGRAIKKTGAHSIAELIVLFEKAGPM